MFIQAHHLFEGGVIVPQNVDLYLALSNVSDASSIHYAAYRLKKNK